MNQDSKFIPFEDKDFFNLDFLDTGVNTLEKIKNFAIDEFIDWTVGFTEKIPAPAIIHTAIKHLIAEPIENIKTAAHAATALQKPPSFFQSIPQASAVPDLLDTKQLYQLMHSPTLPGMQEPLPIAFPKDAKLEIKQQILKDNLKSIGLSDEKAKTAVLAINGIKIVGIEKVNEYLLNARQGAYISAVSTAQEIKETLDILSAGGTGLRQIGQLIHCAELEAVGKIVEIGVEGYKTILAISSLASNLALIGSLSCLGVVGMAAGVVIAVISLFSKPGPNPTQIILDQLGVLSQQLSKMHQDIHGQLAGIRADQARMLEILTNGITELRKDLAEKVTGLRIDFSAAFKKIDLSLDYLSNLTWIAAKNQYLQQLQQYCVQVSLLSLSEGAAARQLTRGLETWLVSDAKNEILTGQAVSKASTPPPLHLKLLKAALGGDERLCGFLGYLIPEKEMLNPLIWHQVATHYIQHSSRFFTLYMDSEDIALERAISIGEEQQNILQALETDKDFWRDLMGEYYTALKQVFDCQNDYIKAFNEARRAYYNGEYLLDPLYRSQGRNEPIGTLNVLQPPTILCNEFKTRSIQHLPHADKKIRGYFSDYPGCEVADSRFFDLPLEGLFFALKDWPDARSKLAIILCAGYLRLVTFSARSAEVAYPEIALTKSITIDPPLRELTAPEKIVRDIVLTRAAPGNHFLEDVANTWTLPLSIMIADQEIIRFEFTGDYTRLPQIDGVWSQDDTSPYYRYSEPGGSGGFTAKLKIEIPKYLARAWLDDHGHRCARIDIHDNISVQGKTLQEMINAVFLAERRNLVTALHSLQDEGHRQALLVSYEAALLKLDTAVAKLKLYGHLVGKQLTLPLLTSRSLAGEMDRQVTHLDQADLTPSLTAAVKLLDAKRIQLADFKNMPTLSACHPKSLLNETVRCLKAHLTWRQLTRIMHPELRYVNMQYYWANRTFNTLDRMRQENYAILSELKEIATGFTTAKRRIDDPVGFPILKEYQKTREAFYEWALVHSRHANATGEVSREEVKTAVSDLNRLARGWECNVALLVQLAESWGVLAPKKIIPDKVKLVNFKFWADGSYYFLRLLDYPAGRYLAEQAEFTMTSEATVLQKMFASGLFLHRMIGAIALSPDLFKRLFENYRASLRQITGIVDRHKTSIPPESDLAIFNALTRVHLPDDPLYVGSYAQIKDKLEEDRYLIANYVSMAFGEELSVCLSKIKASKSPISSELDEFTTYLKSEVKSYENYPLQQRLQDYLTAIEDFQHSIVTRSEYANNLLFFARYLENYFKDNWLCDKLVITPAFCSHRQSTPGSSLTFSFSIEYINLMDQFLTAHLYVCSLELYQIPLDSKLLNALVVCLRKHKQINQLRLVAAQLHPRQLTDLMLVLPQLKTLDLSGNLLGEQGVAALYDVITLVQAAQRSTLSQLILIGNALEGKGFTAIRAAIRSTPDQSRSTHLAIITTQSTSIPESTAASDLEMKERPVKPHVFRAQVTLDHGQPQLKCLLTMLCSAYVKQMAHIQDTYLDSKLYNPPKTARRLSVFAEAERLRSAPLSRARAASTDSKQKPLSFNTYGKS